MVFKEKKLAVLIYLLRYGRITQAECSSLIRASSSSMQKDWKKLCEIPGIYMDNDRRILFSFFYILSHRIPEFYDSAGTRLLLKNVIKKSPPSLEINYSSVQTMREYFV